MAKVKPTDLVRVVGGNDATGVAEWQRTSFYDKKRGTIYIPAVPADVERAGKYKKQGMALNYQGHTYLPLDIIKKLHPDEDFTHIEEGILESIKGQV